jgi:hydroxyethylthiazole kinase
MGLCGELAYKKLSQLHGGTGTYRMLLIDEMSRLNEQMLEEGGKYECF